MIFASSHAPRRADLRRTGAALLLLAAIPVAMAQTPPRRAGVDYDTANDYYAAVPTGRHKVVEQYHLGPCEKNLNARNYRKALGECGFILRIFPNHPQALLLSMRACERSTQIRCELDELFARAIAINPKAPDTYVLHGMHLHHVRKYGEARQSYERALELDADSMNAHYNLGLACIELKDYACANRHAQQAYSLGAALPGLRDRLQKAGQWTGDAAVPAAGTRKAAATSAR